jgi:hypothetical protein
MAQCDFSKKFKLSTFVLAISSLFFMNDSWGQVKPFKEMDNEGVNKLERITGMEKYLSDLAQTLLKMETKLAEFDGKFKNIDSQLAQIKDKELKSINTSIEELKEAKSDKNKKPISQSSEKISELSAEEINTELEKLRKDILTLKNEDFEKVQLDINTLKFSVESIQKVLKINNR